LLVQPHRARVAIIAMTRATCATIRLLICLSPRKGGGWMGHGLGGVLSATPASSCLRLERALTSLESVRWITAYRTPRTALRNLYTSSRAGLAGGRGRETGSDTWARGGGLPAAGSSARSPSGLTTSSDSWFAKVSTSHERWPPRSGDRSVTALQRSRREPVTRLGLLPSRGRDNSGLSWRTLVRGARLQVGYRGSLLRLAVARKKPGILTSVDRGLLRAPVGVARA
jgi:hypothetical protein